LELPILFHDPTSEPSRAVHWFTLEARIPITVRYIWLSRGQHLSAELLAVNPRHQVPALRDADFCLSEATAIIRYLAETSNVESQWLGATTRERARVNQLLSWYHTNLRTKATLEYFLPVLLAPAYHGKPRPSADVLSHLRHQLRGTLEQVNEFLGSKPFLGGTRLMVPDLLFACEIFALDCDHERDGYLAGLAHVLNWMDRLRSLGSYTASHEAWNAVVALMRQKLHDGVAPDSHPLWVADVCEGALELLGKPDSLGRSQ
jgi:glutathione S-transferase